jgi:hypothetical protein
MAKTWTTAAVLAAVGGAMIGIMLLENDRTSCDSSSHNLVQLHPQNPYLFSCEGALYLPAPSTAARFTRTTVLRPEDVSALPFRFARTRDRLYYVGYINVGFDENEYFLRPVEGVDVTTMQVIDEHHVRDSEHVYTILRDRFFTEERAKQ